MKNKSARHKDQNTFKFLPFAERIANIDVDVFHKVSHEYAAEEDSESYFHQAFEKWNVLNLTEGYDNFKKEIKFNNYITLPQVLLSKEYLVQTLIKHLKYKNPLCLQPLLEIVVALAKDLQKEFYSYYNSFLEILIELLNTKDTEQLEWTFSCLAHLFKFLWRPLVKDINVVFNSLLPLLSDTKPDYINNFAAESFAFVGRKVKDKKSFLLLLLRAVKNKQDGAEGCGKLLFHVLNGIDGQFHSSAEIFLPFLIESLSDETFQETLFEILEHVVQNIVHNIHPHKSDLFWNTFTGELKNLFEKYQTSPDEKILVNIELCLKLIGQSIEYKGGKFLQKPSLIIEVILKLLSESTLPKSISETVAKIVIIILLAKNLKLSQEQASLLTKKVLSTAHKSVYLYFVENTIEYSGYEALILPSFLRYCLQNDLETQCFHVLVKIILRKAPLCRSGIKLNEWVRYPIDFKEYIPTVLFNYLKMENFENIEKLDNFMCTLICLPHVITKPNSELADLLEQNIICLSKLLNEISKTESIVEIKKILFLLNMTVECFVHLFGTSFLRVFEENLLPTLLPLAKNHLYLDSLKTMSLCISSLQNCAKVITMDLLLKINAELEINFSCPFHEVRLLTSHIYTCFEKLPEFNLRHSTDPDVEPEEWKVFSICYNVEATDPQVDTYRYQLQNLEKLTYEKPQSLMCKQTQFQNVPLRYLCGTLFINFRLLWEPVSKIIASYGNNMEIIKFWNVFGTELKNVSARIREPIPTDTSDFKSQCSFLVDLYQECQNFTSKPDFTNYRLLLWQTLALFPGIAEAKTRDVAEVFLEFIEKEYTNTSSESTYFQNIKINPPNVDADDQTNDDAKHPRKKNSTKICNKTLLTMLNVFSKMRSPMSMYRESELYKLYFEMLQHRDQEVQKAALDCIMTYKHKYLTPYKEHLYGLTEDKNFKNVVTTFRIDQESNIIVPEHRENLIPIVLQIAFSKMNMKTGLRTGGKSSGQFRRNLILRFLAGCKENEMLSFVKKALKMYDAFIKDDPLEILHFINNECDLEKFVAPKRLQSSVNLLNVILDQFGRLMGNEIISYLLNITFVIGSLMKFVFDNVDNVHSGYLNILKSLRSSCVKIISRFFENFDKYPWNNKQINVIFELFVWPSINKLNIEGIHSPTALLQLIMKWGSNPRYFPLLVKYKDEDEANFILPNILQLLVNPKCHITVINAVEDILEKLLTFQPDEEDLKLPIPVDNLLPVQKEILDKVGVIEQLNYGTCILLPHVPIILEKIRRKLAGKSKNLNQKELFILFRISELVWEENISDSILELLIPVVFKKCTTSSEEVMLKYITTILNLIKNSGNPDIHLKQISPLFGYVNYSSCRKKLCGVLEALDKSGENEPKTTVEIVNELNAFDKKWVDQPDYERRHGAFKKLLEMIDNNNISLELGILVVYNCFYSIKHEKDLALRENSLFTLKKLSVFLIKTFPKQNDYLINETLFPLIRNGIRDNSKDDFRYECIRILGHLARECPEYHFILKDLSFYANKSDLEVDFFENITHLQLHRHTRALVKFSQITKSLDTSPSTRTLTQFVLPIISHYLLKEQFSGKNSLIDGAIEAVGTICKILPWHQYEGILSYYLSKLTSKLEFQKQMVKLIVVILDSFHFDLSKGVMHNKDNSLAVATSELTKKETADSEPITSEDNKDGDSSQTDLETEIDGVDESDVIDSFLVNGDIEESDEETEKDEVDEKLKICDRINILCKSTATKVIRTIEMVLLPRLQKALAELTHHDNSHKINKKKTSVEQEEEDLLRVPISLAVVKLLQRLPTHILESNLPGVFVKMCTFLRSHLESVRRVTRETLQKIMLTLGPKYLSVLLDAMTPLLSRGYQVHVLVFTVHGVLNCLKDSYKPHDIDSVLLTVLRLCKSDLFGILSEEKEVAKIAVKTSEARHTKTYDTLQILAQYITESCLLDVILPIKEVLETSHSYKTVHKVQEALRFIALGLVDNTFITTESLLKFAYGTSSKSIPQLLPKEKKTLTEKEVEKMQREKEDCFIIPKIPDNRLAFRQQNVKTSLKTNAHLLVEFGIRLCYVMLKREKFKDGDYLKFIDPFVYVFRNCLKSKHIKLSILTLQCLTWVLKYELPALKHNIKGITKEIFGILHKYASAGLGKGDNFDLVMAAFKAAAVLVRDVKYHKIESNQLKILLMYVEQDIHDYDRQATAFNLLKAIIARKVSVPEIHDIMQKVAEISIVSELTHVRTQARVVFHHFLMDYPLGNTLDNYLGFYMSQLSFELRYGRESALEMIQALVNSFPVNVLKTHSGSFLISLGERLINDEEPECRKIIAQCISSMLQKLTKQDRDPLFEIVILWFKDKNINHRRLAAQLCGLFVIVEKASFESRLKIIQPIILKQFGLENAPGKFVKLNKDEIKEDEEQERVKDHHLFQVLQLLLKLCVHCPSFLKNSELISDLAVHIQTLLSYPHEWVRLSAAQFLGYVLSVMDIELLSKLVQSNESGESGYLYSDPENALKSLTLDLCAQLHPSGTQSNLAEQVIKNLIFVAKVLQNVPVKTGDTNKVNLLWLTKRMRKIVNSEIVENGTSVVIRTEVFKWIAGVATALDNEKISPVLHHLLAPLVREMITTDESNAPLRQLAKEVSNIIKKKIGMDNYTNTLSKLQETISFKRAERKRARTQLAVTDPEMFAKKKIKKQVKKKESKKRKIENFKGGKKTFKKRKLNNFEDDEM